MVFVFDRAAPPKSRSLMPPPQQRLPQRFEDAEPAEQPKQTPRAQLIVKKEILPMAPPLMAAPKVQRPMPARLALLQSERPENCVIPTKRSRNDVMWVNLTRVDPSTVILF